MGGRRRGGAKPRENEPEEIRICVVSEYGVGAGKSSLVIRLVADQYVEEYDPTIEDSYLKEYTVDGKICRYRRPAGAINEHAVANHEVVGHDRSLPGGPGAYRPALRRSS